MTTPLVFLSHASADRIAAMRVCHALEESGVPCWIAPRNISPGEVYASAISEAIEKCSMFVVIFSAAASTSPHVKNEIENAASCRAPMLICRTDEADPAADSEISLFVKRHQWLVTKPGEIEADPRVLVEAVRKLVEQKRKKAATEETSPPAKQRARSSGSTDSALRAIGLDVGSTKIRCCVRDLNSPETASARDTIYLEPIQRPVTPKGLLGQMTELLARVIDAERLTRHPPWALVLRSRGRWTCAPEH